MKLLQTTYSLEIIHLDKGSYLGTIISLVIDGLEIDWGKNEFFANHLPLYQKSDLKPILYYKKDELDEESEDVFDYGYSKPLYQIKDRLDLLGYTIRNIEDLFNTTKENIDLYEAFDSEPITFQNIYKQVSKISIAKILKVKVKDSLYGPEPHHPGLTKALSLLIANQNTSLETYLCNLFSNIDPYILLRLFAENKENDNCLVEWQFAETVENGYADPKTFEITPEYIPSILIITEGSTDSFVLKKAFHHLYPHISDLFEFIDMEDGYPFTGVGELYKFCKGLCKIKALKQMLVIFDNDTAGIEKYEKAKKLQTPENMQIIKLPNHSSFEQFHTVGPNGKSICNINNLGVSIECFLDLNSIPKDEQILRWTSYNYNVKKYQGSIIGKSKLIRKFKKANLSNSSYDTYMLNFLLTYIMNEWKKTIFLT